MRELRPRYGTRSRPSSEESDLVVNVSSQSRIRTIWAIARKHVRWFREQSTLRKPQIARNKYSCTTSISYDALQPSSSLRSHLPEQIHCPVCSQKSLFTETHVSLRRRCTSKNKIYVRESAHTIILTTRREISLQMVRPRMRAHVQRSLGPALPNNFVRCVAAVGIKVSHDCHIRLWSSDRTCGVFEFSDQFVLGIQAEVAV